MTFLSETAAADQSVKKTRWKLIEWALTILFAVTVAVLVRAFVLQVFYIPSASMEPTLMIGDRVVVEKVTGLFDDRPSRGEVVVFHRPPNFPELEIHELIKRVIAVGGDTIEAADGKVFVNGIQVNETYLPAGTYTDNLPLQTVPDGMLFMMGDNRSGSRDSRSFGPIDQDLVVGVAKLKMWPLAGIDR